jgi:hypothetical protein
VFRRCATVTRVVETTLVRNISCINASVSPSMLAVASSRIRSFVFERRALARLRSCRSPTLKFDPPSSTRVSRTLAPSQLLASRTDCKASTMSLSLALPNGSRHSFKVFHIRTGSCGIITIPFARPRTSDKSILLRSTPSKLILPASISTNLNSATARELLPVNRTAETMRGCLAHNKLVQTHSKNNSYLHRSFQGRHMSSPAGS